MTEFSRKLNQVFAGKVVRKDLTKKIKEGANVPIYVLEYLLGMYCATDDENAINDGVDTVKRILANNFVRPDEAEKVKSLVREKGIYTIIDKVTVRLEEKKDRYLAEFSNLGIKNANIDDEIVKKYERLLVGGMWCIVKLSYNFDEDDKNKSPFVVTTVDPIQIPNMEIDVIKDGRKSFNKNEWIDLLIRSMGIEPNELNYDIKWHYLMRAVPLVENNYNLCELGPRGTGKSHIYKEISPNSILISGGQSTVANLFYNMTTKKIGLVGLWDAVAFDEVAGINFKDKDAIQIMKDYMASGSFSRGREEKNANASLVFEGNINSTVEEMLKNSNLFEPFPEMVARDSAFFDRMHYYLPGWEIPKMRPEYITDDFGFMVDYLAEYFREMRKITYGDSFDKYFKLGNELNQRDVIAIRKTVSGLVKLIYPNGIYSKDEIEEILIYALKGRRRVKEQLRIIAGDEFKDTNFSYIDIENDNENFVLTNESKYIERFSSEKEETTGSILKNETSIFDSYRNRNTQSDKSFVGFELVDEKKEDLDIDYNKEIIKNEHRILSISIKKDIKEPKVKVHRFDKEYIYVCEKCDDSQNVKKYQFDLKGINVIGDYDFSLFDNDELIADKLVFKLKNKYLDIIDNH